MSESNERLIASMGCGFFLFVMAINGIIGAICWPYTINTWLIVAGKESAIVWWHGFLMAYVPGLGQLSIPGAVITWIIQMFM